ncbi:MAG TPA: hypothetical protein VGI82_07295, partial [Chitinophagaceae bacterium]
PLMRLCMINQGTVPPSGPINRESPKQSEQFLSRRVSSEKRENFYKEIEEGLVALPIHFFPLNEITIIPHFK